MPTPTYDLIASNVLSSSASSVTFSSIPATYRDLIVVCQATPASPDTAISVNARFNSDSGSNYPQVEMTGYGTSTLSQSYTGSRIDITVARSSSVSHGVLQIMDYSATDKHKTTLVRFTDPAESTRAIAGRWANTAAINTVSIVPNSGQFASGSTFYLYGIVS